MLILEGVVSVFVFFCLGPVLDADDDDDDDDDDLRVFCQKQGPFY